MRQAMKVLAISGSLRAASSNLAILQALKKIGAGEMVIDIFSGLGDIPAFNPDLEGSEPLAVLNYRRLVQEADAVIISSPEYIHCVPGALKNALDWVVATGEFIDKPLLLLSSAERATYLREMLTDIMRVIGARLAYDNAVIVPLATNSVDAQTILADQALAKILRNGLDELKSVARTVPTLTNLALNGRAEGRSHIS